MKKVVTYIILAALCFSTIEIALKIGGGAFDSMQLTFLRFLVGGIMLAPFGVAEARRNEVKISAKDWGWLLLVGIVGIPISMVCFQIGVQHSNASTAAVLMCMNPLFTMMLGQVFTSEKMTVAKYAAFILCIAAGVILIRPWDVQEGNSVLGVALVLFASVTFAAYTLLGKRTIHRLGTICQTSISFIGGSLVLLVIILCMGRPVLEGVAENPLTVLYCGIVVTGLGYLFYFLAIRYSDATTGSITFFIKPAIAPALAMVILGERIYWNTVVGVVLLLVASIIMLRDKRNKG